MNYEKGFLHDILANPTDDTPRLVFADWLEDHGQEVRGEFIRAQCDLQQLPLTRENAIQREELARRAFELRGAWGRGWAGRAFRQLAKPFNIKWQFQRGFVDKIQVPLPYFRECSTEIFQLQPVHDLTLTGRGNLSSLLQCPELKKVRALGIVSGNYNIPQLPVPPGELQQLFSVNVLPHLAALHLDFYGGIQSVTDHAAREISPFQGLKKLSLNGIRWTISASSPPPLPLLRLLGRLRPGQLCSFSQRYGSLLATLHCLNQASQTEQLQELSCNNQTWTVNPDRRFQGLRLPNLHSLSLHSTYFPQLANLEWLLFREDLQKLTYLDLGFIQCPSFTIKDLLPARLPELSEIILRGSVNGNEGAADLAQAVWLTGVTGLDIGQSNIGTEGLNAILESPYLQSLYRFNLQGNPIGSEGIRLLAESDSINRVWWLDLRETGIGEDAIDALCKLARRCPKLTWLDVRRNVFSRKCRDHLRGVFGRVVRYDQSKKDVPWL